MPRKIALFIIGFIAGFWSCAWLLDSSPREPLVEFRPGTAGFTGR